MSRVGLQEGSKSVIQPDESVGGALLHVALLDLAKEVRGRISEMELIQVDPLIDSSDLLYPKLDEMTSLLREFVRERRSDFYICVFGTDQLAYGAEASRLALPYEMDDQRVIFTCSQKHFDADRSDAIPNLANAITFASMDETRGMIGVSFRDSLLSAIGFQKPSRSVAHPFTWRGEKIIKKTRKTSWMKNPLRDVFEIVIAPKAREHSFNFPMGSEKEEFKLHWPGPRIIESHPGYDYEDLLYTAKGIAKIPDENRRISSFILKLPGQGNARSSESQQKILIEASQRFSRSGIPFLLVGNPKKVVERTRDDEEELYAGDLSLGALGEQPNIISGGGMAIPELSLLTSRLVAKAMAKGLESEERVAFVMKGIAEYPYL